MDCNSQISVSRINITSSTGVDVLLKEFHWDDCISDFSGIIHFLFYYIFSCSTWNVLFIIILFFLLYLYNVFILIRFEFIFVYNVFHLPKINCMIFCSTYNSKETWPIWHSLYMCLMPLYLFYSPSIVDCKYLFLKLDN